jgi:abnormal spindle-like microcephaly-associated protein
VHRNFALLHAATSALGHVPEMLSSNDFLDQGPDERAVILYSSFLCARLLEVSKEERAAHVIQTAWASYVAAKTGAASNQPSPALRCELDRVAVFILR